MNRWLISMAVFLVATASWALPVEADQIAPRPVRSHGPAFSGDSDLPEDYYIADPKLTFITPEHAVRRYTLRPSPDLVARLLPPGVWLLLRQRKDGAK